MNERHDDQLVGGYPCTNRSNKQAEAGKCMGWVWDTGDRGGDQTADSYWRHPENKDEIDFDE